MAFITVTIILHDKHRRRCGYACFDCVGYTALNAVELLFMLSVLVLLS